MFFLLDSKNPFGRAFIKLTAFISYKSILAHRAKMLFGSQFILACTYGGKVGFLQENLEATTVLFRPAIRATDFELWQCKPGSDNDCKDISTFQKVSAKLVPIVNGAMYAFVTDNHDKRMHYVVKGKKGSRTIASGFVVGKMDKMPSTRNDGIIEFTTHKEPVFSWQKEQEKPYWISFLMIHDYSKMISGIYSFLDAWQFPEVDVDVPYYYHERRPVPKLQGGKTYEAVYMAIDQQGWVTQLAKHNWVQKLSV